MRCTRFLVTVAVLLLATVSGFAQGLVTGQLTGTVTSDGSPLPGVTVTVSSPALQGTRTTVTDANGNYNLAGLPPGDYTVHLELAGLQSLTRTARVTLSGTARVDADMRVTAVTEAITVTASAPAVLETTEVQANFDKRTVDDLPINRTVTAVASLAPGVNQNGPRNALTISGAMSSDNLVMVNGANIQENLRGQPRPLFIEDAIQETTVMSGAISAEFGRFTGGVINAITRSGGNQFTGSLRDSFTNPRWTEQSEAGEPRPTSTLNQVYEATLGGFVLRDRLWFFLAGRSAETTALNANFPTLAAANQQIFSDTTNRRYEAKLTGSIAANHTIVANYLNNPLDTTNDVQLGAWELSGIDPSIEQQEDFRAAHYNGIFTPNLFGEAVWSKRQFTFIGFGGENTDILAGTPLVAWPASTALRGVANAPYFCGSCDNEKRDNELLSAKLSWFHGTRTLGTHNVVAGFENYQEFRLANNFQSPTNLTLWMYATPPVRDANGNVTYTFTQDADTVEYFPVEFPSLGSDLDTTSFFLNDKLDLNKHWSFNLGVRFDDTNATDSFGNKTADETSWSPRLGVTFDPTAHGRVRISGTFAHYVGRLAETVQGAGSPAGEPSFFQYYYNGPTITGSAPDIVRQVINWFMARGGTGSPADFVSIGGFNTRLAGSLVAPGMAEWTAGAGWQFSPNGYFRADYIDRQWENFYGSFTNLATGQVTQPTTGDVADLTLVANTDLFERAYRAIQAQATYRFFNRLNVGGNYTLSELRGNYEGENAGSGPISEGGWLLQYPEFQGFTQNRPVGFLAADQRHRLRAWAAIDVPLAALGTLNVSVLERYDSGLPYSAQGLIPAAADPNAPADISSRYVSEPRTVTYFFSDRGEFRFDNVTATDLGLNYRLGVSRAELFIEADIFNVFNEQALIAGSTAVITPSSATPGCTNAGGAAARCAPFNPFTDTPVEGRNFAIPSTFGGPTNSLLNYQTPRTYQVSLGVRF